jgi:hypothetical protein
MFEGDIRYPYSFFGGDLAPNAIEKPLSGRALVGIFSHTAPYHTYLIAACQQPHIIFSQDPEYRHVAIKLISAPLLFRFF